MLFALQMGDEGIDTEIRDMIYRLGQELPGTKRRIIVDAKGLCIVYHEAIIRQRLRKVPRMLDREGMAGPAHQ